VIPIYLTTSDKTMKILPAQAYCINKFWPGQEVHVLGYAEPTFELPENFFYHSLGRDPGPDGWSTPLIDYFKSEGPNWFIFSVDDMLPIAPVNQDMIDWLLHTHGHSGTARIGLTNDIQQRPCHEYAGKYMVVLADNDAPYVAPWLKRTNDIRYRVSTLFSIWRRQAFIDYILPGVSPWMAEVKSIVPMSQNVIGTRGEYAIHNSHGLFSNNIPQHKWDRCLCKQVTVDPVTREELGKLIP